MRKWQLIELELDDLSVNELNPKTIDPKNFVALKESIETFGLAEPLVYNLTTKRIVGGNQRLKVLQSLGETKVQVMAAELTEAEEKALMMIFGNQHAMGKWDIEKALARLDEIRDQTPDLYANLAMGPLRRDLGDEKSVEVEAGKDIIPEMEIQPFEHWDYIVLVFNDSREWLSALEYFDVGKVKFSPSVGPKKIGLGRVINGKKFLEKIGVGS